MQEGAFGGSWQGRQAEAGGPWWQAEAGGPWWQAEAGGRGGRPMVA